MEFELDQMFGAGQLFVEPRAFRAWLATAKTKAIALASPQIVQDAIAVHAQRDVRPMMLGEVAVIDVCGPITYKSSWLSMYFGLASIEDLQTQFRMAMADATASAVVFRVDSPGGTVDMMPEFADEVFEAKGRGSKSVYAVADTMIASCAYWLASQADAIYATASSQLGAIGVFAEHAEISGMLEKAGIKITLIAHGDHKTDANPYEPLSDAARADLQAKVDEVGGWFDAAVARGRKVSKAVVLEQFGQGKMFRGAQAIKIGLADEAGTFGQLLAKLASGRRRQSGLRGAAAGIEAGRAAGNGGASSADWQEPLRAGVVPKDVSDKLAPKDTPWSALRLEDFTDQPWDKLSTGEKRHIAGYFAWSATMPPEKFDDLKLGHHRPSDGAVVFRGVTSALGRLDQTKLPAGDAAKVRAHLERHEKAFEKKNTSDGRSAAAPARAEADADDPNERPEMMDPVDGECQDGYAMGEDGMCHLSPADDDEAKAKATADAVAAEHEAIRSVIG